MVQRQVEAPEKLRFAGKEKSLCMIKKMQAYNKKNAERLFKKNLKVLEKLQKGFFRIRQRLLTIDCLSVLIANS